MSVTRVKTSAGWVDLQQVGPTGPQGPPGTPLTWVKRYDPTTYNLGPASPAKMGGTIMDISITLGEDRPVWVLATFAAQAASNSNSWHALWRNGGVFLNSSGPADYRDWLVGSGGAAGSSGWFGTFLYGSPNGGTNAGRMPLMPCPMLDWPGIGTHVYSLAHGGTGAGGAVWYRTLAVGY